MKPKKLLLSCEHAVNDIPEDFAHYFKAHHALLNTHRGIDFGALQVANQLSQSLGCDLITASVSRLLIDFNRSLTHPHCFSEISLACRDEEKNALITKYYQPYRNKFEQSVRDFVKKGYQVCHVSVHSFTPIWHGETRRADVGLLYDPQRPSELHFAKGWQNLLKQHVKVRRNYPYRGTSDGFTVSLRKQFKDADYLGIELEMNQAISQDPNKLAELSQWLVDTLRNVMTINLIHS
jgi:predicted N-formylglutamate amidohydrolase